MKKILAILAVCSLAVTAQGAMVIINCFAGEGGSDPLYLNNFNVGGGSAGANSRTITDLLDQSGNNTGYSLDFHKTGGNYFAVSQTAFTNTVAYNEVISAFGLSGISDDVLLNAFGSGAGGSRTDAITFGGLGGTENAPLQMTLYMWVGSNPNDGGPLTGITSSLSGEFSYAANSNSGFSDSIPTLSKGELLCIKWTGEITADSLVLRTTGGSKFGASLVMYDISPIPEPTSAALGLIGLSFMVLRRRKS